MKLRHFAAVISAFLFVLVLDLLAAGAAAQSVGWQARWDGGLVESSATAWDVTEGPNGNLYAAAEIRNGSRKDLLTLAWSPAGDLLWYRLKDGLSDSDDVPAHLIVDGDGRVIVVGTATRSTASWLVTVAYDAAGNELWARTNRNPAYRWNRAQGVAVGADGRVVVVGEISNGSTKWTSLVAYDSTGNLLWERVRDLAPDDGAVAMDPGGILAVAGRSNDIGYDDFLTVAYDAGGNELWARSRDGTEGRDDTVRALVMDANGRFVVTGISETGASGKDILTVAYDLAGNELWAATQGGSGDQETWTIAADSSGNVFLAGAPSNGFPNSALLIVSYDSAGLERWAVTVADGAGESSSATDMTVSADGNVVVTGRHYGPLMDDLRALVLKVSGESGAAIWTRIRTPAPDLRDSSWAVAPSATGLLLLVGSSQSGFSSDALAIAYDASGNEVWARKEPLISAADVPGSTPDIRGRGAIATGYDGRVYLTGTSFDGRTLDYLTVAYDASGRKIWEARKSNPNDFQAFPAAIAVDPANGNVYVTGTTRSPFGNDYLTVAYDRTGAELWSRTRQGASQGNDLACCIAVNADGLVIVTGYSDPGQDYGYPDMLTVAYEPFGNEVWSDEWGPGLGSADFATSLAIGATGVVYVGGSTTDGSQRDALTVAYDASGNRLWSASRDGGLGVSASILALAPTPDGGVAATGNADPYINENILTVAYGPDGTERWAAIADSASGGWDVGAAITVDADGRTFVTGWSQMPDLSDLDFITLAYDGAGGLLWSQERGGVTVGDDYATTLSLSSLGTLFVTGSSENGTNLDFLTVAYSPGGYELFEHRYDGGGNDQGYLALAGPDGSAFIGGVSDGSERDFFIYQLFDDTGLFSDGFASGDTTAWSAVTP